MVLLLNRELWEMQTKKCKPRNANQDLEQMIGGMIGKGNSGSGVVGIEDFDFRDLGVGNERNLMNMARRSRVRAMQWVTLGSGKKIAVI